MKHIKVKVTFTEPVLGTSPGDPEIYSTYIASKAPDAKNVTDEIADSSAQEVEDKRMTIFFRDADGNPFLYDYQIKGFIKNACKAMKMADGSVTGNLSAYKSKIDNAVFILGRRIPFQNVQKIDVLQRPLRASTPQGDRVALSSSEQINAGAFIEFDIITTMDSLYPMIKEWLDYGILNGIGQWHNGGYGRFVWEEINEDTTKKPQDFLRSLNGRPADPQKTEETAGPEEAPKKRGRKPKDTTPSDEDE